jgi:hypothetical protein
MSGSYGEESAFRTQQNDINKRAKEIVCEFFNSLDNDTLKQLKLIKERYSKYVEFDTTIRDITSNIVNYNKTIKTDTAELKSSFTFFKDTKEGLTRNISTLNQRIINLKTNLTDINNSKLFIDNLYLKYKDYVRNNMNNKTWETSQHTLDVYTFFSRLVSCERIVHTTAHVVHTPTVKVVAKTTSNNVEAKTEATLIRNKYLKYKQKYLSLKNKIN